VTLFYSACQYIPALQELLNADHWLKSYDLGLLLARTSLITSRPVDKGEKCKMQECKVDLSVSIDVSSRLLKAILT